MYHAQRKWHWVGADLGNEEAEDRLVGVLAGLQDQLTDITALQKKHAALELTAQAADGTVEATVNASGQVIKIAIDKSYLNDHDFEDLGDHVTEAARAAAADAASRVAEMLAPINERHNTTFPLFSDLIEGIPDPKHLMPPGLDALAGASPRDEGPSVPSTEGFDDDGGDADLSSMGR